MVDNATPGFDPTQVTVRFPAATVRPLDANIGFGRANNLAAEMATGSYLWLLNPDTLVPADNDLGAVLGHLDHHPNCAAASPLLLNEGGSAQPGQRAAFPSLPRMVAEKPAKVLSRLLPATRGFFACISPDFSPVEEADVPVMVAASLFVRATAFSEVEGFSPEFFMFLEDSDLCRKFAALGYRVRFVPRANVVHLQGRSIRTQRERKRLYYASVDTYLTKWARPWDAAVARALRAPFVLAYNTRRHRS